MWQHYIGNTLSELFSDQYFIELRAQDESTGGPKYCDFLRGVAMFNLVFLGYFFTKMRSFCAHQTGNFLNFSKITLLLSLAQFWTIITLYFGHPEVFLDGSQLYPLPTLQRDQLQEAEEQNLIRDLIQNKYLWAKIGPISDYKMGQNVPLFNLIKYISFIYKFTHCCRISYRTPNVVSLNLFNVLL